MSIFVVLVFLYFVVTLAQVWLTSREYSPIHADAIVVMGTAQFNGVPSPDLQARLDEVVVLYDDGYAPLVAVTGYKQPGDKFTEAQASEMYLEKKGIPKKAIIEGGGTDTYGNIATIAPELHKKGVNTLLVVTDPFHEDLSMAIVSTQGFKPYPTPTKTSPIRGTETIAYFAKESIAVGLGRIIGYNNLHFFV